MSLSYTPALGSAQREQCTSQTRLALLELPHQRGRFTLLSKRAREPSFRQRLYVPKWWASQANEIKDAVAGGQLDAAKSKSNAVASAVPHNSTRLTVFRCELRPRGTLEQSERRLRASR